MKVEKESNIHPLEILFKPKNAVILNFNQNNAFFVEGFKRQGFDLRRLYLISSKEEQYSGIKCYKTIEDVQEDTIDLLILSPSIPGYSPSNGSGS